jgi:hypothetical protein
LHSINAAICWQLIKLKASIFIQAPLWTEQVCGTLEHIS